MQKIKVAIVDDEPLAREVMRTYLQKQDSFELVGVCKNALEAFSLLHKNEVQLLLLDIDMPHMSGMDFLKTLKNPPLVIFTTAYSEYALESYELNAIDYLLKPISPERFELAMSKVLSAFRPIISETEQKPEADLNSLLFVRSGGKWMKIELSCLRYVAGLKDYVSLWTEGGRIIIHSTMKNLEEQLQPYSNFVRVHKSYIVNLEFVSEAGTNTLTINGESIPVGSSYKEEFQKRINALRLL